MATSNCYWLTMTAHPPCLCVVGGIVALGSRVYNEGVKLSLGREETRCCISGFLLLLVGSHYTNLFILAIH